MFVIENLGHGRGVQHSQRCHSMVNIIFYKKLHVKARILTLVLTVFEILTFQTFDLENVGQGQREQHSQ